MLANVRSFGAEGEHAAELRLQRQVGKTGCQDCMSDAAAALSSPMATHHL
jgi:hypothetical protein